MLSSRFALPLTLACSRSLRDANFPALSFRRQARTRSALPAPVIAELLSAAMLSEHAISDAADAMLQLIARHSPDRARSTAARSLGGSITRQTAARSLGVVRQAHEALGGRWTAARQQALAFAGPLF